MGLEEPTTSLVLLPLDSGRGEVEGLYHLGSERWKISHLLLEGSVCKAEGNAKMQILVKSLGQLQLQFITCSSTQSYVQSDIRTN